MQAADLFIIVAICLLCIGCERRNASSRGDTYSEPTIQRQFPTEDEVRRIIVAGATERQIVQAFGRPDKFIESDTSNGTDRVLYQFALPDSKPGAEWENRFSGFEVNYKSNKVVNWEPVYSTLTPAISPPKSGQATFQNSEHFGRTNIETNAASNISFYIVSESEIDDGIYFNNSKFPRLGYISNKASLAVKQLEWVKAGEGPHRDSIIIGLTAEDARRFKQLTSQNVRARMLVTVNDKPIIAPIITSPIESGTVEITGINEGEVSELKQVLDRLVK